MLEEYRATFNATLQVIPPRGDVTKSQKTFFLIGLVAVVVWVYRNASALLITAKKDENTCSTSQQTVNSKTDAAVIDVSETKDVTLKVTSPPYKKPGVVSFDDSLKAVVMVFLVVTYYFICDYLHVFPKATRMYNRDLFVFLLVLLVVISIACTSKKLPTDKFLNREQTEEWKGWMQIMFVWYHYFNALETYNAIRIFIACYVWMTGFGNFSFFWVREDFSLRRIFNSLFRLNFLVVLATVATNNAYMLYYICAMHTFWYISVYAMMRPYYQNNKQPKVMALKFAVYFIVVLIIFEVPGVSSIIFKPFCFVLNLNGSLHEWIFRSTLDHYATFVGMICAYFHPNIERSLKSMSEHWKGKVIAGTITMIFIGLNVIWYNRVYVLDKYTYNKIHPYTCFLPILTYIFLRNSTQFLRQWHCGLLTFFGKITLETYISQLHIYMQQDAKSIVVYLPNYPLLNLLINTFIYVRLSTVLFHATLTLNQSIFPSDKKHMWRNISCVVLVIFTSYSFVYISKYLF